MFRFAEPQWLLLLPAFALLAWSVPRAHLWVPLRAVCLLLLTLILARPELRHLQDGLDLWVLVDRSASASELIEPRLKEVESLIESGKGKNDRVRYVDFASYPVFREQALTFESPRSETRLRLALDYATALMEPNRSARILLFTDGFSTEPPAKAVDRLLERGIPVDFRLFSGSGKEDPRITSLDLPARVRPGEPFLMELKAEGLVQGSVPYEISRDGEKIAQGMLEFHDGHAYARFVDRSPKPGARAYEAIIVPAEDSRTGNNTARKWVEVSGGNGVLLLSSYQDDPVATLLTSKGIPVEVPELSHLNSGMLSGARAVIINNVPAYRLPAEFLASIDFFVNAQGGGLMMAGGRFSFGSGGYFQSPVDPLLPISMELRQEHRKLSISMAIVMDRSGSMAAGAGTGVTKMDLANEGAARAVELLGSQDAVTVLAVDSEPHIIVPFSRIGGEAARMSGDIRRVTSGGGGIFVYTGLKAAWEELKKAPTGQRHVILFADAADAEEPADYLNLLAEMTAAGATVSVIGLGQETDSDANFLKDVADKGKGRIFFNADPSQLPALFAQETIAVARSAFLTDPVPLVSTGGWAEIAARPMEWPGSVDAYNLSYLKAEAGIAAMSGDSYKAPLVAFWQRGAGRVAAVSFPLGGEFSEVLRQWSGYGDFLQSLTRWMLPQAPPPGMGLRITRQAGEVMVELLHDETWIEKLTQAPAHLVIAEGSNGKPREISWERMSPGRLAARLVIPPGSWLRGAVQVGIHTWPFGPVSAGVDPEWDSNPERVREIKDLATLTGGGEIADFSSIWKSPRPPAFSDLRGWLICALLLCFLAECGRSRWMGEG